MAVIKKIKLPDEATARDIGALSSNIIYDGDTGVTTTLNSKIQSIFTAIGDINSFEIAIVSSLPTTGEDHTIYFVPESAGSTTHSEYMYIDNQWELIGSTTIDLSNYVQFDDLATVATSGSYSDLSNRPTIPTVPTNVSAFNNDAGYLTTDQNTTYTLSMSGPTITLTPSSGTASTITLPIWDGTLD